MSCFLSCTLSFDTCSRSYETKEERKATMIYERDTMPLQRIPDAHLYLLRFEVRDETGRYLYDNAFLVYVKDEVELHTKIAEIAATRAKRQRFLGAEKRVHGMTIMHEHLPVAITPEEKRVHGTQE